VPDESAPLAFLEKSHCVPILMALYKKGMMNRNQLYNELGQTINIVIKRINFLIEKELIIEYKMKVKPFAKFIDLTPKGREIAKCLQHINLTMTEKGLTYSIYERRIHIVISSEDIDNNWPIKGESWDPEINKYNHPIKLFDNYMLCPKCNIKLHMINDNNQYVWLCFNCGYKEMVNIKTAIKLYLEERDILDS